MKPSPTAILSCSRRIRHVSDRTAADGTPVESYDQVRRASSRFLYTTALGGGPLRPLICRGFSRFMGHALSSRISRVLVGPFIRKNHLSMEDYPPRRYRPFNDFFTRTILPRSEDRWP